MTIIMLDKHFLGIHPLQGSVWRSPRIPPQFIINTICGGEHGSRSSIGRHSTPSAPSPIERPFTDLATTYAKPSQGPVLSLGASSTTALSTDQPLRIHHRFVYKSPWLEPDHVLGVVLLLVLVVFLGMLTKDRYDRSQAPETSGARTIRDVEPPFPDPFPHLQLTEAMGLPTYWEAFFGQEGIMEMQDMEKNGQEVEKDVQEVEKDRQEEKINGQEEKKDAQEVKKDRQEEKKDVQEVEKDRQEEKKDVQEVEKDRQQVEKNGQKEKIKEKGGEAGEGDGKEDREEKPQVGIEEGGRGKTGNDGGNAGSDVPPSTGKKKKRIRQNAKKRATRRAAAEEPRAEGEDGDGPNTLIQDRKELEAERIAMDEAGEKGTAQLPTTTGKGEIPLPPRPPNPQPKEKLVPVELPPKPHFTGLPNPKSSGTLRSLPDATANATPGSGSLPPLLKESTHCKESVPPASSHSTLPVPVMAVDYTKWKNFELEALLKARSLRHTGSKAVLIARLQRYDTEKVEGESDWEDEGAIVETTNAIRTIAGGSDQLMKPTAARTRVMRTNHSKANGPTDASKTAQASKERTGAANARPGHQRSILHDVPTTSGPFTGFEATS